MLRDCHIVVPVAVTFNMLLKPAPLKLTLFAEWLAGSLNLSHVLPAAQSRAEPSG